jgi:hypothetical protein
LAASYQAGGAHHEITENLRNDDLNQCIAALFAGAAVEGFATPVRRALGRSRTSMKHEMTRNNNINIIEHVRTGNINITAVKFIFIFTNVHQAQRRVTL